MPIDFPNSPTNGQIFTESGVRWQYDGTAWNVIEGKPTQAVETKTASYTPVTGDGGKVLLIDSASATTVTIDSALDLALGDRIDIVQMGTGQVTVAASSVTLNGTPGLKLRARYSAVTLLSIGTDTYVLLGDLAT